MKFFNQIIVEICTNLIFSSYFFFITFLNINAQSIDEIKNNHAKYIWGEGCGTTLKKTDKNALPFLINQISTAVESKFEQFTEEDCNEIKKNY